MRHRAAGETDMSNLLGTDIYILRLQLELAEQALWK